MNNDVPEIVVRVLQGTQTEEEMRIFLQWYSISQENRGIFFQLKQVYDHRNGGVRLDVNEVEESWERLLDKLKKSTGSSDSSLKEKKRIIRTKLFRNVCAAVITALLLVTGIYFFCSRSEQMQWVEETTVANSGMKSITLSDGTMVLLNASTKLKYPQKFSEDERCVYLDGEALFSVKEDKQRSFVVYTDKQRIDVLGTVFNVLGYAEDPYTVTTLVNGKVKLGTFNSEKNVEDEMVMYPDDQAVFDKDLHHVSLSKVNTADVISWTKGVYSFRDTALEDICRRFEKLYGVTFVLPNIESRSEKYTGKFFAHQPVEEVVSVLNFKQQFQLTFHGDTIIMKQKE